MQTVSYNLRPDNDKIGAHYDGDEDEEPPAGRIDYAQKDKIKVNVKEPYPIISNNDRTSSAKRKKISRLGSSAIVQKKSKNFGDSLNIKVVTRKDSFSSSHSRGNSYYERMEPASATKVRKKPHIQNDSTLTPKSAVSATLR